MAESPYVIDYSAPPGKINRDLDQIDARLVKTDALIDRVKANFKTLGADTSGVKTMMAALAALDAELKSKVTDSTAAARALKGVGGDNAAITAMTAKLKLLETQLESVTAAAGAARAAGSGIGGGGGGAPGAGGGPGAPPGKTGGGVGAGVAIAVGVMAAGRVLSASADAGQQARDYLSGTGDRVGTFANELREYGSLRHSKDGSNDAIVREAARFGKQTALLPGEIVPFLTSYEGSATTGRDAGNIGGKVGENGYTQQQQDALEAQLKVVGAQFSVRTGLDAKTAGDLTGVASTYKRFNSPADLAGQLGGMHFGLDQGRGEITPLARGELGQAGSAIMSGRVSGLPELGAFIGVASVASKSASSAGTTYGQASRLLNETGEGDEKKRKFLEESGIHTARGDFAKLKAMRDHLDRVKPEDANSFLESQGFGNSTDRRSVLGMVGNVGVLEERIKKANAIAANGAEVLAMNQESQRGIGTADRRGEANDFASEIDQGLQMRRLAAARKYALGRLKDTTQPGGARFNTWGSNMMNFARSAGSGFQIDGQAEQVDDMAMLGLIRGGKKAKVDVLARFPNLAPAAMFPQNHADRARDFSAAWEMVQAAGGDPFGGAPQRGGGAGAGKDAANKLRVAADAVEQALGGPAPPPERGGPQGGGGFNPGRR